MKYFLFFLLILFLFSIGIYFYVQHEVLEAVGLEFGGHDH